MKHQPLRRRRLKLMGTYRERLFVPVSYWLLAVGVAPMLGAEAYIVASGFIPPLVIAVLFAAMTAVFLNWGGATIEVASGVLRAGRDTLPLSQASEVIALDERQAAALRGPRADPAARLLLRPYLKRAVCVRLTATAAADGAPYWLLATRRPDELAAAIERARQSGDRQSVG